MKKIVTALSLTVLVIALLTSSLMASDVYPLLPKALQDRGINPQNYLDTEYPVSHHDGNAEYYLGSGALDDTFFVVFEPPAACIVKGVEVQWYNAGNINAFAAWYSEEAEALYPDGTAPNRGDSPVSPIGDWITSLVPNASPGYAWADLDLEAEWVVGDSVTLESDIFGVGWVKLDELPQCLADGMDVKGIRFTYTWFGGPWMEEYPNDWGAYSSDILFSTVVEVMMTVWVEYPWGMPILISNVSQKSNTFSYDGPYTVTCVLEDDPPGINEDDIVELHYKVNSGTEMVIDLERIAPGSDIFYADIPGQAIGSEISYWIETIDDGGLENFCLPKSFMVLEPNHPDADLLFVDDGTGDRWTAYHWAMDESGYYFECWDVGANKGIDESVTGYGWSTILVGGWGVSTVPALDDENAYSGFLDGGGNMALFDQDYFYANGLGATGTFVAGDFAYDYLGLNEYWNDPDVADDTYMGEGGDPIAGDFEDDHYVTYWDTLGLHMDPGSFWADYFSVGAAEDIFYGVNDAETYGCKYENGFKTVFLSFMPEANGGYNPAGAHAFQAGDQFVTLVGNTLGWFETVGVPSGETELAPSTYSLNQNYPNPFNSSTLISFTLENAGMVTLKVYNMLGQEAATLIDQNLDAGPHMIHFDATGLTSGMYYYKLTAGNYEAAKSMLLVK
ncbi:MAG: T9SS type A sorting domain-containing protein [candidate division Zixibacteria bacterium]|nr:T9SS type A sorting domain-containing protein [Candidatus Tariuqbacter arcticus]